MKYSILNQRYNYCVLKRNCTISHQINEKLKQRGSSSKKYLYSCSNCRNVNIFSGKHIIKDSMHHSDRVIRFTFLLIHYTVQKCKSRKTNLKQIPAVFISFILTYIFRLEHANYRLVMQNCT